LRFFLDRGANTVFITLGRKGVLAGRGKESWQAGIYEMIQVDPSGSGDAFDAGVITGILQGWDLPTTIRYASSLGASAIRALGTTDGVFTAEEAQLFLDTHRLEVERIEPERA
jgi:sugar/nucleoside kinase (ribokinase family)